MKILHFVYIPFTGVGLLGYRGHSWFSDRIKIFKNYTLKSLKAQTNKDFVVWISFRPQERENPLTQKIVEALKEANLKFVLTFDGLMYHDDKFSPGVWPVISNSFRVLRRCWRLGVWSEFWPSIRDIWDDKNVTLPQRLERSLKTLDLRFNTGDGDLDLVYLSRIDSDDMFHRYFVEMVQIAPASDVITCKNGYIYNTTTGEVAEWLPKTNPPFHTIIFSSPTFFTPWRHLARYGKYKSHEDIPSIFYDTEHPARIAELQPGSYCVTTSSPHLHISTIWNHPFRGKLVDKSVLKDFGL